MSWGDYRRAMWEGRTSGMMYYCREVAAPSAGKNALIQRMNV
jgi:hypothetical protein